MADQTDDGTNADPGKAGSRPAGTKTAPTSAGTKTAASGTGLDVAPLPDLAPQPVSVGGYVTERKGGTPVALVDVIFTSHGGESTATTDQSGQYSLVLSPGTYQVRAIGDRVMAIGLPPFVLGRSERRYDVSVVEHAVIHGHVHRQDGSGAVGAIVAPQIQGNSDSGSSARGELGSAEVQPDGSFELLTLPGNLILNATSKSAAGSAEVLNLQSGEAREKVRITMIDNGYIAGAVVTPSGGAIGDAAVLVSMQIPGSGEYDRIPIATDSKGRFSYQVLRPGHTIVEASARGFAQSTPLSFTLAAGESRNALVLVLHEANLSLSGQVVDLAGEPLAYVEVAQGQEGSKERYKKVLTNGDGEFSFANLGPGPHRLRARKTGYQQTRLREIAAPARNLRIEMAVGIGGESASN